jgi:mannose-1-phosphate guanylyltransferase/mannose-6-phosphate isomerase
VPADFDWSDLGTWDALGELLQKDKNGNVLPGNSLDLGSSGLSAFSRSNRLIATIGLKDLIIADTPDALLVCDKQKTQEVKKIVERLKSSKRKEHIVHLTDKRPWGFFTVLMQGPGFKIKLIEIEPKKRLSLQAHKRRAEHWVVVSGCAKVNRGKDIVYVNSNESIYIPRGIKHRLENHSDIPLKIVEVQTGSYLEEDDIRRFDDDFRR